MSKRLVSASRDDLVTLLSGEAPFTRQLSEILQTQLQDMDQGSLIYLYDPASEKTEKWGLKPTHM